MLVHRFFMITISALALLACSSPSEQTQTSDTAANATVPDPVAVLVYANFKGNAVAGKTAFLQCQSCHALEPGKNGIGPSLAKVIGKGAGKVVGYNYSAATKASPLIWSEEALFDFLGNPRGSIPGNKMSFSGISDGQKRADIIAYIKANGGA